MSSKKFWNLSFFEWSIWLIRIKTIEKRRQDEFDFRLAIERNTMALHARLHGNKGSRPEDFYTLSSEREKEVPKEKIDEKDLAEKIKKVSAARKKKRNG